MKKGLKIAVLILFLGAVLFLLVAANKSTQNQILGEPNVFLTAQDGISLLTEKELKQEVYSAGLFQIGIKKSELNEAKIEAFINEMDEVLKAHVYTNIDNTWNIELTTRRPIARVMNISMNDFYINEDYHLTRLSPYSKPKVLPFTGMGQLFPSGMGYKKIINNDSLKTKYKLDQMYRISKYVCNDAFYNAQIVQVQYTKEDGFVLIPRVGEQVIIFGAALSDEMVVEKFKKLTIFYNDVIPYEGWNKYKSINLKFKNQIVAKKRK